ncbi:MAG: hypothetical protein M3P98_01900 [bacterium]|nr:hypothetical protein [bacterium]
MEFEKVSSDKIIVRPSHTGGYFKEKGNQWDHLWITGRNFPHLPRPSDLFEIDENGNIVSKTDNFWLENPGASNVYSFVEYGPVDEFVPFDPFSVD